MSEEGMLLLSRKSRSTKCTELKLSAQPVIDLLTGKGVIPIGAEDIEVKFMVPGGDDWTGMEIGISNTDPILVSYTETSIEEE